MKLINGKLHSLTTEEQNERDAIILAQFNIDTQAEIDLAAWNADVPRITLEKLAELKDVFTEKAARPRVATLGFFVDGGYNDLANFQIGKDLSLLTIMDADGVEQTILLEDYDTLLLDIKVKGLQIIQANWVHKAAVAALTTVEELNAYDMTTGWPA